jgi:hypothetical protein
MSRRRAALATALAGLLVGGLLYRRATTPFPYRLRGMLDAEFPGLTRDRLLDLLEPREREEMLEIGPGTGYSRWPSRRGSGRRAGSRSSTSSRRCSTTRPAPAPRRGSRT